jgi:hypothetical protein
VTRTRITQPIHRSQLVSRLVSVSSKFSSPLAGNIELWKNISCMDLSKSVAMLYLR